jgi:Fe-S cluster assembly scaffold protein SufB
MKGIVGGRAQAVYRGLVHVAATAPKSNGYQRVNTLLLSSQAEVDAVPKLEIKTDDVRCTHGATTSHVNPEQLFYLQSRGLSAERAAELVVSGFLQSVVLSYPEAMRSELAHAVASSVAQTLNP